MKSLLLGFAAVVALTAPSFADWRREGTVTGPRGKSVQVQGQGSCANDRCDWSRTTVGPEGRTFHTAGSATRTAPGRWTSTATTTGPHGGSVKRQGGFQVIR